jgi:hypothetical protein
MKKLTNRLMLFFAVVGLCAMIYSAWHYYQQERAAEAARTILSAPYTGDTFDPKNHPPPPPQP